MRARGRLAWASLLPVLVALLAGSMVDAAAQGRPPGGGKPGGRTGITVTPQQDLSFGLLTPGVSATVFVDDVVRRAEWLIQTTGNASIMIVLPRSLQGAVQAIPLSFAYGDAGYMEGGTVAMTLHDPGTRFQVFVPADPGFGRLFLGGTAFPSVDQAPGTYTATVTIIVAP